MDIVTADLYDKYTTRISVCETPFMNFGKRRTFFGKCHTIKVNEDHLPLLQMVNKPVERGILVVDGGGSTRVGVFGDGFATIGARNGWIGFIVFGAIRDTTFLEGMDIGVKALNATARARRGLDPTEGVVGVPVEFGSAVFEPGDWVYADPDCVLVSKFELELTDRSAKAAARTAAT
jgi:regulator of ribonuclease activity A